MPSPSVPTTKLQILLTQWASNVYDTNLKEAEFKKSAMELVAEGADLTVQDNGQSKSTLLHVLVTNNYKGRNDTEITQILSSNKKLADVKDGSQQTPLQYLLSIANSQEGLMMPVDVIRTAMILARQGAVLTVSNGLSTTCPLLDYVLNEPNRNNWDQQISELLTINKALANVLNKEGQTPLQVLLNQHFVNGDEGRLVGASSHARIKKTAMLFVDQEADPSVTDQSNRYGTLLHYLFMYNDDGVNDKEIAQLWPRPGLRSLNNRAMVTPLNIISSGERFSRKMLEPSPHFQVKGKKGFNLLHITCSSPGSLVNMGHVFHLITKGIDIKATTDDKSTVLHCSVATRDRSLWEYLKTYVDINAQDVNKKTALHLAVEENNIPMVKWLIANKANLFLTDNVGKKASSYTTEAAALVLQAEALDRCNRKNGTMRTPKEQLYFEIEQLRAYGDQLNKDGVTKGKVALDVAAKLLSKADEFFKQTDTIIPVAKFTDEFSTILNSKNKEMSEYRTSWSTILKNIAIALTGVGALFIAGQLIYSKASSGRALFFFQHSETSCEEKVGHIANAAACIA